MSTSSGVWAMGLPNFETSPTGSDFHRKIEWGLVWHILQQDGDLFQAHMVPTPFILAKSFNSRTRRAQFFG